MKSLKVALNFNRMNDGDLSKFTNNVITCMTGNASFSKLRWHPPTLENYWMRSTRQWLRPRTAASH